MRSQPIENPRVDPSAPDWEKYYASASKRRHEHRHLFRTERENRKRRRVVEILLFLGSVIGLAVLMAIFRSVLSR